MEKNSQETLVKFTKDKSLHKFKVRTLSLEDPQWELLRESLEGVEPTFLEFVQKRILKIL